MAKVKKKLTTAQKRAKKERRQQYETVFMNGKQVRIKRPPMVEGMTVDEFIMANADPLWLHQNEMWELIPVEESSEKMTDSARSFAESFDDDIPF